MWSFIDNQRILRGLHAGNIDGTNKKAILFTKSVKGRTARWLSRGLTAR